MSCKNRSRLLFFFVMGMLSMLISCASPGSQTGVIYMHTWEGVEGKNKNQSDLYVETKEIKSFLNEKISYFDNFSSDTILQLSIRIFDEEFHAHKKKLEDYDRKIEKMAGFSKWKEWQLPEVPVILFTETISFLNEVIKKRPYDEFIDQYYYLRGYSYEEQGDGEKASEDYIRFVENFSYSPLLPEVLFRLGEYYFSTEQYGLALETYMPLLEFKKSSFYDKTLYKIGWSYYLTANFETAITYFLRLADLTYAESNLVGLTDYSENDSEYLDTKGFSDDAIRNTALCFSNVGNADDVLKIISAQNASYTESIYIQLAEAYFDQSKYEDFNKIYDSVLSRFKREPTELELQKRLVSIRKETMSDEVAYYKAKEEFIAEYSPGGAKYQEKSDKTRLNEHLKPIIQETAKYYHRKAQKTGDKELYLKADILYRKFLDYFPKSRDVPFINFYLAETLFEQGKFLEAGKEYEKLAEMRFKDNKINEKAAYSALLSYEEQMKVSRDKIYSPLGKKVIATEDVYLKRFPLNVKSGPLFFRKGRRFFEQEQYATAIASFRKAKKLLEKPKEKLAVTEYVADSFFNSKNFFKAEREYEEVLKNGIVVNSYEAIEKAKKYIPLCHVNIAEELKKKDKIIAAARRYQKAARAFRDEKDKKNALLQSMNLYIQTRKWTLFDLSFDSYKNRFNGMAWLEKVVLSAAKVSEENYDYVSAGKYFELSSSLVSNAAEKLKLLMLAAHYYDKGEDIDKSITLFTKSFKDSQVSPAQRLEFRYRVAELNEQKGDRVRAVELYREIVKLHLYNIRNGRKGNTYYYAKAKLTLLEDKYNEYVLMDLTQPFEKKFKQKLDLLGDLLKEFMEITKLDQTDFTSLALYKIGTLFENFRLSVMISPPPTGLNADEEEEYQFMLEEKAFPYEEKSVKAYEKNVYFGRLKNITNSYIDSSYERLASIQPALYKRDEEVKKVRVYAALPKFIPLMKKIDPEKFENVKEADEEFWLN